MKPKAAIHWQDVFKKFLPVFIFAAVLPVVLASTFTYSSADRNNTLRVWFEPATVSLQSGETVELTVFAQYADAKRFLNGLSISPKADVGVELSSKRLEYTKPFQGSIILGTTQLTAVRSGTYHVTIEEESIQTSVDVELETGPATILVK